MVELPRKIYEAIVQHAQEGWPNEICGLIAGNPDPIQVYRVKNSAENPMAMFIMDSQEQFKVMMEIEEKGWELYGIYHSHPSSEAYPSQMDKDFARFYPDVLQFICSLEDRDNPRLRAFYIIDGDGREQGIRVVNTETGEEKPVVCC